MQNIIELTILKRYQIKYSQYLHILYQYLHCSREYIITTNYRNVGILLSKSIMLIDRQILIVWEEKSQPYQGHISISSAYMQRFVIVQCPFFPIYCTSNKWYIIFFLLSKNNVQINIICPKRLVSSRKKKVWIVNISIKLE